MNKKEINSGIIDSVKDCLKEVERTVIDFLKKEGGRANGFETWATGVVYLSNPNGKIEWCTASLAESENLTVKDYYEKSEELYCKVFDLLKEHNVSYINISNSRIAGEFFTTKITTNLSFESDLQLEEVK
jgi:hypothetical protein